MHRHVKDLFDSSNVSGAGAAHDNIDRQHTQCGHLQAERVLHCYCSLENRYLSDYFL